jgi:ssDNA-binding Zn-finger/Zn-ribbon topoisomerase 1
MLRTERPRRRREPVTLRACVDCGATTVVAPCACGRWFRVCDCFDKAVAFDKYLSTNGRCPACRGETER